MNDKINTVMGLFISAAVYTFWGLVASVLYTILAPELGMPHVSLSVLLGLWWMWFLVFTPPVLLATSVNKVSAEQKDKNDTRS